MSVDEYNEDEFEEVEEEEEKEQQTTVSLPPVPQPTPPTTEEPIDDAFKRPNNLFAVNQKRNIDKKANSIRFFLHFALNKHKPYGDVAKEVGVNKAAASKYIDEYASVVINSIEAGTFPDGVLTYYNDVSMPKGQRLTARHVQELKSILLRYKKINVDSMLGEGQEIVEEEEEEQETTEDSIMMDDIFKPIEKTTPQPKGQFKKYNEFMEQKNTVNTNPRVINESSPIQDVIEFGLINAGANDAAKIRRIKTLFMSSPNFYLADEGRFKDLLLSNLINEKTLNTFLDWFKYVSPIRGTERVGFLNLTKSSIGGNNQQQQQQQQQGKSFNNFNIDDYDEFAQFLYHEGVFRYGYPPNHPVNQENYKEYQEKKKIEKEEQQTMRQFNLMTKKMLMDMQAKAMGLGGTSQQVSSPGIAFDERLLFERGIVAPEITYTEDGKRIVKWIPTGKSPYDAQQMQQQQPTNSLNDSVNMFSRLVEALRPIFLQNTAPAGQQNPLMDKMLTILLEKSLNKVEETPSKVLENQMNLFSQFKQFFPQQDNIKVDPATMQLQLELAKIQQDGKMAEREIEIKEKMWSLEQQRLEEQKHESKDNITMIMEYVQKGIGFLGPVLQSLLMGQMGGGLSNMMGNIMGGGNNGGMADMMQQQQQSPFIPQDSGMMVEEPSGGIPPNIPPEFLPQEEPSPVYQEQFIPQPLQQPVYQQEQQQFIPQPPQQPTVQEENNFLDSVTPDDLSSLDLNQLHDIENRIDSKIRKLEKVYNNIKSTKAKKEFGFTNVDKYSVLDVPSTIPPDYDGLKEQEPTTQPHIEFPKIEQQTEFPTLEDVVQEEQNQDPFDIQAINDNYNNDIYQILDMGNDNQQFNQQNNVNQKDYIDEQARKEEDRVKAQRLAHLQSIGCSNANIHNLHLYDDNGNLVKTVDTSTSTDSINDSASPTNRDTFNQNPDLNDSKTGPSEEFQKQHQNKKQQQQQTSDKQAHENREQAREEQQKRWQTSESVAGNTNDNKAETNYSTTQATSDSTHNKEFGQNQQQQQQSNKKDKDDKKEISKKSTTTSTATIKNNNNNNNKKD